ncbi:MAG: hypothetical protein FWG79_06730 [Bacteroidales bacterium]|nr:hypothetical protein [Bacteroidales bacterium]
MKKSYLTLAIAAIAFCFTTACGGGSNSGGQDAESQLVECDEGVPEFDGTVEGFEKFMKAFVPKAEKMAKLKGDPTALMNEMAFTMEFQEYSQLLPQWVYWIEMNRPKFSAEEEARVDKAMEPLQ